MAGCGCGCGCTGYNNCCCCPVVGCGNPCGCGPCSYSCCCGEPVMVTGSTHTFRSCGNCEHETLCCRSVDYVTEYVTVPVQRPIVHETIARFREVPVDHVVDVVNRPEPCGNNLYGTSYPRACC